MLLHVALKLSRLNEQRVMYSTVLHYFALKKEDGRLCLSIHFSCLGFWNVCVDRLDLCLL